MEEQKMQENISSIQKMKDSGCFKNYIEYIQFPYYKNLVEHSRINFDFPLTILIGKNGGGKSSTLHALYGAPKGFTITIREFRPSLGAGFIVALTGSVMTMPGLPKVPSAENIYLDDDGEIVGIF